MIKVNHVSKRVTWCSGDAMSQSINSKCIVVVIPDKLPSASERVKLISRNVLITDWATRLRKFAYYSHKLLSDEVTTIIPDLEKSGGFQAYKHNNVPLNVDE